MEIAELIFSIIASVLSIVATVIGLQNKNEIRKMCNEFQGNKLVAKGDGNAQVLGSGNRVSVDEQ